MTTMAKGWTPRERALLALCVASFGISLAAYFDLGGTAGGAPRGGGLGNSITSNEIRNGTIRSADIGPRITSADIVNGSIRADDLGIYQSPTSVGSVGTGLGTSGEAFAACSPEDVAISGGFGTTPDVVGIAQSENFYLPRGPSWHVVGVRVGQGGGPFPQFSAEALCLNN